MTNTVSTSILRQLLQKFIEKRKTNFQSTLTQLRVAAATKKKSPINRGFSIEFPLYMFKAFISQPLKRFRCTLPFDKSILSTFLPFPVPCTFPRRPRLSTSKFDECSTRRSPRESRLRAAKLQLHRRFDGSASLSDSFRAHDGGGGGGERDEREMSRA